MPSAPLAAGQPTAPTEDQLQEWRLWLSGAKSQAATKSPVSISPELAEYIQSEFVRERKEAQTKGGDGAVTSEDLGLRLTLAKYVLIRSSFL